MRTSAGPGMVPALLAAGTRLGAWEIESPIAAGGMGQVYRARRADGVYDQSVALKLIHDRDSHRVERFAAERQRLAEMDHPGIARIIDGGTHDDGRPWMAMELVDGAPILPQAERLLRRKRLELFVSLCAAVSHAHGRLVLHRDIKAANVLLDAAGQVRLIDFGISTLSEAGAAPGGAYTPATAAPEQMRGDAPTVATDVFALGALLHQLLVGQLPVRQDDGALTPNNPAIADADLAAIVARATALVAAARYASVDGLADDVQAALDHRPVAARGGGTAYRIGRFMRRFPVASGLAAATVAALVGGILVSTAYAREAEREATRARQELARAEFFLARAEALNDANNAYGDLLRRITGNDTDVERESRLLMARWAEAHASRKIAPARAAAVSYAVGMHFSLRNDNQRAIAVLEPWIAEGYGPKGLIGLARVFLANSYDSAGQDAKAIALMQRLDREMSTNLDANSINHVQVVSDLAAALGTPDAQRRAVAVIEAALKTEREAHFQSFLWNQLGSARLGIGDRPGATAAYREAVRVGEANPLVDLAELATERVNLAAVELYFAGRPNDALTQTDAVLGPLRAAVGENVMTGFAYMLRGEAKLARGDAAAARVDTETGLEMIGRFNGMDSASWQNSACAHVAALLANGDLAAAETLVLRMESYVKAKAHSPTMAEIARGRLLAARGDIAGARQQLARARANKAGLERGMPNAWRLAQAEAWVAAQAGKARQRAEKL